MTWIDWLRFSHKSVFDTFFNRLTESGLSITQWNLLKGMRPPQTEDEWMEEFNQYKQFPEYK